MVFFICCYRKANLLWLKTMLLAEFSGCQCFAYSDGQIEKLAKCDHFDNIKHNYCNWYATNVFYTLSCCVSKHDDIWRIVLLPLCSDVHHI